MEGALDYICKAYGVPAKIGGRIKFGGKPGMITEARGAYLTVRLDGQNYDSIVHPTWEMEYLTEAPDEEA